MDKAISFDLHDTILILKFGGDFKQNKVLRAILYFLSNFKSFVFTYTLFCQRNEQIIQLMQNLKKGGSKVFILTSTNQRCAKIIYYFLKKNNISNYDGIFFRKEFWQKENQFVANHNRDTMLALHIFDLPTPWGYRNEIFYEHQGKLLDIGTVEHLSYAPVFNEQKGIIDIGPFKHSIAVTGVGVERISMIINGLNNVWDVDTIKPLIREAEKLFNLDEIKAMQIVQALRVVHRIITDCRGYSSLNTRRKKYFRGFIRILPQHINFNGENLQKIKLLLELSSELEFFYPELKLSVDQTVTEIEQRVKTINKEYDLPGYNY
ncbi:MAG: hypothetical protein PHE77_02380 [Candidatus Pacebacteria bacterium]|nr:hypothetical protein [Candidatus Paceibacterota bacterium]